jgi:hypothetical protein
VKNEIPFRFNKKIKNNSKKGSGEDYRISREHIFKGKKHKTNLLGTVVPI